MVSHAFCLLLVAVGIVGGEVFRPLGGWFYGVSVFGDEVGVFYVWTI